VAAWSKVIIIGAQYSKFWRRGINLEEEGPKCVSEWEILKIYSGIAVAAHWLVELYAVDLRESRKTAR
jgi:hypothetical protein